MTPMHEFRIDSLGILVREGELLEFDIRVRQRNDARYQIMHSEVVTTPHEVISLIQITTIGNKLTPGWDGRHYPWSDVRPVRVVGDVIEQIAEYVAGDGTDAARIALADGIRSSLWEPLNPTPKGNSLR